MLMESFAQMSLLHITVQNSVLTMKLMAGSLTTKFYATSMKMQLDVNRKQNAIKKRGTKIMNFVMLVLSALFNVKGMKLNALVESML